MVYMRLLVELILYKAHEKLEEIALDKETHGTTKAAGSSSLRLVYNGQWYYYRCAKQ